MNHFLNKDLLAPNARCFDVDAGIAGELLPLALEPLDRDLYFSCSPPWHSDIQWISASRPDSFERFQDVFDRLGIAEQVGGRLNLDREVRMYGGYLVVRSACSAPDFHSDWRKLDYQAFTLISPLTENAGEFGLLYIRLDQKEGVYRYRLGEAIIFGDHFMHSTAPGRTEEPVVLLSFTFGSDRMEYWDRIWSTAQYQSKLCRRPDGESVYLDRPD